MIHQLNVFSEYFLAVASGKKTFAVVKKDKAISVGDMLAINECENDSGVHTGNSLLVYVDYIQEDAHTEEGYVAMSIKPCVVCLKAEPYDRCKITHDYSVPYATRGDGVE